MSGSSLKSVAFWGVVGVGLIMACIFFFNLLSVFSSASASIGGGFGGGWRNGAVLFIVVVGTAILCLFLAVKVKN